MATADDVASAGTLLGHLKAHGLLARASAVRVGQVEIQFDALSAAKPPADKVQAEREALDEEIMYGSAGA